jgi:hypothetical protein
MYPSITVDDRSEPFNLQVARGQIEAHSTVNIYGYQTAVATSFIPVWENATAYAYPSGATLMRLVSTTAGDTASIQITGLDANYAVVSEIMVLTGTTPITTTKSYIRINSMQVTTGSATNPAGTITLKDPSTAAIYAQINPGVGRTQAAIYTVPAGYTFYLARVNAYTSLNGNNANFVMYRNLSISSTGVFTLTQQSPFTQEYSALRVMPRPFLEKTDIQLQAKLNSGNYDVSISAEGYLIKNVVERNGSI